MKRLFTLTTSAIATVALLAPALLAEVKTTEKTTFKMEGLLGRLVRGGDGVTSTVAVKGDRMSSMTDTTGEIIDLTEERVYRIDIKKKEYKVVTFEQLGQADDGEDAGRGPQRRAGPLGRRATTCPALSARRLPRPAPPLWPRARIRMTRPTATACGCTRR